ncbi:MAG: ABC transporter ATP-binding protein [Flavobacteriales bacterium]|jgi:ABC-2 type transport system ATP-binding protein|nr:ABC transporter ATP-binding protein [Flavobacteriales bacterium]
MKKFHQKLQEIQSHLNSNDISLAFRKLVDCVLDAKRRQISEKIIPLADIFYFQKEDAEKFKQQAQKIIEELKEVEFVIQNQHQLLKAKDICKKFTNFQLEEINLSLSKGEIIGLVGENGNGKTTLLRILAQDLNISSGMLSYPFSDAKDYKLRTELVYIPQRTPKSYGAIKTNLKYIASQNGVFAEDNELLVNLYMIRFDLWKFKDMKWAELSSGYKMRFELAKTMLRKPKILLLDEPLANLDILNQQLVLEDLKSISESLSNPIGIILSSQQLYEVEKIADHIIFLKNGKPTYLHQQNEEKNDNQVVIELEIDASTDDIKKLFKEETLQEIHYNGGYYIIHFNKINFSEVLKVFAEQSQAIRYIRDISQSSRRFFQQ